MDENIRLLKKSIVLAVRKRRDISIGNLNLSKASNSECIFKSQHQPEKFQRIEKIYEKIEKFQCLYPKKKKHKSISPHKILPTITCRSPNICSKAVEDYSDWEINCALQIPKTHKIREKRSSLLNSLKSYEPNLIRLMNNKSVY